MKFSIEVDDKVLKACDREREALSSIVKTRNAYINLVLALYHNIGTDHLAKVLEKAGKQKPAETRKRITGAHNT